MSKRQRKEWISGSQETNKEYWINILKESQAQNIIALTHASHFKRYYRDGRFYDFIDYCLNKSNDWCE